MANPKLLKKLCKFLIYYVQRFVATTVASAAAMCEDSPSVKQSGC